MIKTYREQLESVQASIAAIEERGQAYGIAGRTLTRADLGKLYARESELRRKVAREDNGGGVTIRYGVPRQG